MTKIKKLRLLKRRSKTYMDILRGGGDSISRRTLELYQQRSSGRHKITWRRTGEGKIIKDEGKT